MREANEDAYGRFEPTDEHLKARGSLYIVADGMGGHAAGDVASRLAVQTILDEYFGPTDWDGPAQGLRQAIQRANEEIYREGQAKPALREMGTTVVAVVVQDDRLTVANVGDSRAYLLRQGQLEQITRDHSWVAKAVEEGVLTSEQAADHPDRHVIYRSLGSDPQVEVDISARTLQVRDRVLLCSDGLTDMVTDQEMADLASEADLASAVQGLIDAANEGGGADNITVTLLALERPPPGQREERPTPRRLNAMPVRAGRATESPDDRETVPRGLQTEQMGRSEGAGAEQSADSEDRRRPWWRRLLRGE